MIPYAGLQIIKLRTYTNNYPYIHSTWTFDPNNRQPMEFAGYVAPSGFPQACIGNVFDLETGITNFTLGNAAGGTYNTDDFGGVLYSPNQLKGFVYGGVLVNRSYIVSETFFLGTNKITSLNLSFGSLIPVETNTGQPFPNYGANWAVVNGIYSSYGIDLVAGYYNLYPDSIRPADGGAQGFTFNHQNGAFVSVLPWNGQNYVLLDQNKGYIVNENFSANPPTIVLNFVNPNNSNINVNAAISSSAAEMCATYQGWMNLFPNAVTCEGRTLNGYGILIAPDFSSYKILGFVPEDVTASTWNSGSGNIQGKFDLNGALWIHHNNDPSTLFVSAGNVLKELPIFPPVALPTPPADSEKTILPLRGPAND
jgi:hypothetical protein